MPLLPFRTRIRQEVLGRLSAMTAGTVYWSTPSLVTDALLSIDQYDGSNGGPDYLATGPIIGVVRTPGSELIRTGHDTSPADVENDGVPGGYSGGVRFAIVGYVRAGVGEVAADVLERVQQDVETCLREDPTLGGLVDNLMPDGPDDNDGGVLEPSAMFGQEWVARKW